MRPGQSKFLPTWRSASEVYAMARCLSAWHKLGFVKTGGQIKLCIDTESASACPTLCFKEIRVSSKTRVLPSVTFFQILNFSDFSAFFCHGMSVVTSIVNLVRSTAVTILSFRASTFVYNAFSYARCCRFYLRQLSLVINAVWLFDASLCFVIM